METEIMDKRQLREYMKKRRDEIPPVERSVKSESIAERLRSMDWYSETGEILVYSAIRSEVDLTAFCHQAWKDGKVLYFPRVSGERMEFYQVDSMRQLEQGTFSVMEPRVQENADIAAGEEPAAGGLWSESRNGKVPVLVPGVAFSREGARVGYGKGFYDRYLALHPSLVPIGICFDRQLTERICADEHDYWMSELVTEYDEIDCRQNLDRVMV